MRAEVAEGQLTAAGNPQDWSGHPELERRHGTQRVTAVELWQIAQRVLGARRGR